MNNLQPTKKNSFKHIPIHFRLLLLTVFKPPFTMTRCHHRNTPNIRIIRCFRFNLFFLQFKHKSFLMEVARAHTNRFFRVFFVCLLRMGLFITNESVTMVEPWLFNDATLTRHISIFILVYRNLTQY